MTNNARYWGTVVAILVGVIAVDFVTDRPPPPKPEAAPQGEFAEGRAIPIVRQLSEVIGARMAGTDGAMRAADFLAERLRAIPRVEVEVQDAEGELPSRSAVTLYATRNVIARLPGRSPEAVLLSAHYDTPNESVGAADDGAGVATLVEVLRVLAEGPVLSRTVIVELNGAEERGLLGAAGFLQHRWAHDVHSFINLEAAGAGGRAILFRVSAGNAWLADAYAHAAPRPFGNVIGQDLFQMHLVPSDTDYTIFDRAHVPGLDVALFEDGYAYHTALDRLARLQPGSIQHMGDDTLAVARALAERADVASGHSPPIYYDLLGRVMLTYSAGTARLLAVIVATLALVLLGVALRRRRLTGATMLRSALFAFLALVCGVLLPLAGATLVSLAGRSMGWFATPALAVIAYGPLSLAGVLSVIALRQRRKLEADALDPLAGVLLVHLVLLALLTKAGLGVGYLFLWWSVTTALCFVATLASTKARVLRAICMIPVLYLSVQILTLLLRLFVPVAERMNALPVEPLIAVIVALPIAVSALALFAGSARVGRAALACAAFGVAGMIASALSFPYTAERPRRLFVEHEDIDGKAQLVVHGGEDLSRRGERIAPSPVAPPDVPMPELDIVPAEDGAKLADGARRVHVRVRGGDVVRITLPAGAVRSWSLKSPVPAAGNEVVVRTIGMPHKDLDITFVLGPEPVPVEVKAVYFSATPAVEEMRRKLPAWSSPSFIVSRAMKRSL